ncbi:MAG TPA: MCP four helix bundle domain-containing protein [Bryobacteraceae bacterium]|nr:MCP four helix bundle domain-containing protein [Bryobacteraceae bacterium]
MLTTLRTWPIVALTFVVVMLISALVTILTFTSIKTLRASILELNEAHHVARGHIEALRSQIYVSSILVRDILLDTDPARRAQQKRRLSENHSAALRHLSELEHLALPQASATVRSLAAELEAYWQSMDEIIGDAGAGRTRDAYAYLESRVIPRRQAVVSLAEELADLSSAQARVGMTALNRSLDEFQRYILVLRTVTTLFVAVLAVFVTIRIFRLERAAAHEHDRLEIAEAEMRKLSQQLVNSQEQERRSLSRELHDHVGQMMTALRFTLSDLDAHSATPTKPFANAMSTCRAMLEQTIEAIRGLAMGLRPSMLDDLGLAAAIEWQAREFSKQFDIPVSVHVDPALADWPEPQRTALYRITQEALTNCARHANAKSVLVELLRDGDQVRLKVSDDGVGLAPGQRRRGFGLIGMEERVREIGGKLTMESAAGGGTSVRVEVPAGVAARA